MNRLKYSRSAFLDHSIGCIFQARKWFMLHGDWVTQGFSTCGSIIPKDLEPMKGGKQHRGSLLLYQKLLTLHWLELIPMAAHTCQRDWEILRSSHPARRGNGFWGKVRSPYHRPHSSFSHVCPSLPSCFRPICHPCNVTYWEFYNSGTNTIKRQPPTTSKEQIIQSTHPGLIIAVIVTCATSQHWSALVFFEFLFCLF